MFEEVFYLAAQHERISAVTRLYAPPFRTLAQVHDKGTFQELCDRLEIRTPHTTLTHAPDELDRYAGTFYSPELDRTWWVMPREGRLHLARRDFAESTLEPAFPDGFSGPGFTLRFVRDAYRYILQVVRMVVYFNPLKVLMPPALWLITIGLAKALFDIVVHPLRFAVNTVLIFITGLIIGTVALLADLIVRSRGDQ